MYLISAAIIITISNSSEVAGPLLVTYLSYLVYYLQFAERLYCLHFLQTRKIKAQGS